MALVALRRHSICRAIRQSCSLLSTRSSSSSPQQRHAGKDLFQQGQVCNAGSVVGINMYECSRVCFSAIFSNGGFRSMSGHGIRSRVEKRMRKETGKTLREIRRAKKLRKKLMTEDERLIFSLRRAKKKVALLLQKLKKYELPELPPPRHDPELLTPEQLQALRKLGFKNKNYVPVGVRGVFGGVVQNMHLHWKFHETVQVCCDNFPKEKIKEMAIMLARLSGGTVVNIHNVKTIIMYRGRNYRQPKILIPLNTLTKRKALFKARFEQALESQKINIKKIEQQLRRLGVNPEDPIAMASVQKVASTFFRAIDEKQGSPYVVPGNREPSYATDMQERQHPAEDSDQEELDRFIAEIEQAADDEWAAEEAAEKEEIGKIRYWNRPASSDDSDSEGMNERRRRGPMNMGMDIDSEEDVVGDRRGWRGMDDRDRRAQRDNFDSRGQRDMFDRTRRSKDINDDWDSEDEAAHKGKKGMRNMDDDWDTEDKVMYNSNRCEGRGRNGERVSTRGQMYASNRNRRGKNMDENWDSEDEVAERGKQGTRNMDDGWDSEDEMADERRLHKHDMYNYLSSEEEVDYNNKSSEMFVHDDSDCEEEVVVNGRRQEIDGDKDWENEDKVVDNNRRKKHIDESWDSD
eukprot:Gb_39033 [translate_table: standard]